VRFGNRRCFTGAMVLGSEVLLGAIPMEDMDLVLRRQLQSLEVNPESPNLPTSVAMRVEDARHRPPIDAGSVSTSRGTLTAIPAAVLAWQT
jgi:hypothetical protein